jgi:hypothetical protein
MAIALIIGVCLPAFAIGWIVGRDSQRKFNRRMSDIDKRKRSINWPIGHKEIQS